MHYNMLSRVLNGLTLVAIIDLARGYFIMRCETLSVQRTDPVLSPGFLSSSVNRIVGGTAYDMSMGVQDTKSAQNTSCTILEDKSNYWATQLYSQSNDNTFSLVQGETVSLPYLYKFECRDIQTLGSLLFVQSLTRHDNSIS